MKRTFFFGVFFLLFFSTSVHAQLIEGEVLSDGRKLTHEADFIIYGNKAGELFYELSVNRDGVVLSERMIPEKCTVNSTPLNVSAKNYLKKLKFTPKSNAAATSRVVVKLTVKIKIIENNWDID